MSDDDFELLGQMVDRMDNLLAASVLPMPSDLRVTVLTGAIEDMRTEIYSLLIGKGFNPWAPWS